MEPFRHNPSRRHFLRSMVAGSVMMPALVSDMMGTEQANQYAPRKTHFSSKARRVIFINLSGGVSHLDTFDHKPQLYREHGKEIAKGDHPEIQNRPGYERIFLKTPQWQFKQYGQCGKEVSSLFPEVARCVDDIAFINSMHTSHSNHYNATLGMHTGSFTVTRPSIGAWVSYGLGTENQNLPSFIVIAPHSPYAGGQVWGSDFLPGAHQGTRVVPGSNPVPNITPRVSGKLQELELAALRRRNQQHLARQPANPELAARMRAFETAFGMQMAVPEAFDFTRETDATHELYGLKSGQNNGFGWQCLAARRLAERGVRFIELIHTGSSGNWDSHGDMMDHERLAKQVDRPIYGLLTDLKQRGLLDDTLVVWTTEFGRTPFNSSADHKGREHHNWAFTTFLAGAGVNAGHTHGATDEIGLKSVVDPVHTHDFHATILHLLGLNHERLTYFHDGRDFRLTDVSGQVVNGVLA
ncbi:MAG: hypothetical protein CMO58_08455 [Verrucomicrobiales bacterium]|nr:hypothetical protein [Verrucomicrobiales bacterium]